MKKELGDIIKNTLDEASSSNPPAMDWDRLDNASVALETAVKSKGISLATKTVLGSLMIIVSLAGGIIFFNKGIQKTEEQPNSPEQNKTTKTKQEIELEQVNTPRSIDSMSVKPKEEIIEKNFLPKIRKEKKKDNFKRISKEQRVAPNAKKESKTTTIYEVDTITIETYIYE